MLLHFLKKMRATFKTISYKSCGELSLWLLCTKNWSLINISVYQHNHFRLFRNATQKVMKKYKKISNYKWSNRPKPAQISDYSLKEPHRIFLQGLWPHFFKQACVDIGEIRYIHTYTTKNLRKFQLICFAHSSRPTRAATFELNDQLLKFTRVL